MPTNTRKYRDHLYEHKEHPDDNNGFVDQRDSFFTVYISVIPFLILEYMAEITFHTLPSGVVFPVGFLLFWAFYYTYYKPGFLESRLSNTDEWDFFAIPTVLLGVLVWFVKVTVVGTLKLLLSQIGIEAPSEKKTSTQKDRSIPNEPPRANPNYSQMHYTRPKQTRKAATPPPLSLPSDVQKALDTLGIPQARHWQSIHHRYRELAKKYHPDLNPDLTDVGRRFMMYDSAYRKLSKVKNRYFK